MAITRVGGDKNSVNAADLPLDWSVAAGGTAGGGSQPAAGDFALLFWNGQSGLDWGGEIGAFTLLSATVADSGSHEGRVYYRKCDGTETGTLDLSHSSGGSPFVNKQSGILRIWRGVDQTTPISDWNVRDESVAGTSHANPQVTTGTANEAIVTAIQERVTASSTNYTAPSGYSKLDQPTPLGGGGSTSTADADDGLAVSRAAGTAVTPPNWTNGTSTANVLTWTIALRPAATSTPKSGTDTGTLTEGTATVSATTTATDSAALTETPTVSATSTGSDNAALTESAAVTVMGEPTFRIAIDWNNDGDFYGPGDDVTDRILNSGRFVTDVGRDQARALSPPKSGQAAFTLDNISGDYSPENPDSPLAGDLLPARAFKATVDFDGTTYTLFRGHLDDFDVRVERNAVTVAVTALDVLAKLRGAKVSTQLYAGIRVGDAIGHVLDAVGWPAELRDLDPGATVVRWWWLNDEDAFDAIMKLLGSEGPGAIIHAEEDGGIVFRDRHHRLLNTTSTISQASITDGADGWEPAFSSFSYDHGWRDVVNSVAFSVEERDAARVPESVYDEESLVRSIPTTTTVTVEVRTSDPVVNPRVAYTLLSGSVTVTLTQVAAQVLQIQLVTGGTAAAIRGLKVTAQPLTVQRTYQITAEDQASIDKYGARSPTSTIEAPWAGVRDAAAIADLIVGARSERLPMVSITMRGFRNDTRLIQQIGRDLSDRVTIRETRTGLDADFFIEQIGHSVAAPAGGDVVTTFGMEKAAQQAANVFRFNDAAHGFNDGVFAVTGLDDPANLFIFDVAGHGFNDGVFAT